MVDRTAQVQAAVVARLKADAAVAARVGARVYDRPPQSVAFPYLRIGETFSSPADAAGLAGGEILLPVECWSAGPSPIEGRLLAAEVSAALHDADLTLGAGAAVYCYRVSTRDQAEPDGVRRRCIVEFQILTDG